MEEDVHTYIRTCDLCQKHDPRGSASTTARFVVTTTEPMQRWAVDTIGPMTADDGGHKYALVIIDTFTRYIGVYAMTANDAVNVVEQLLRHMSIFGVPTELVTDCGTEFNNQLVKALMVAMGTAQSHTVAYSKEENGLVERANKEVLRWVRDLLVLYDSCT